MNSRPASSVRVQLSCEGLTMVLDSCPPPEGCRSHRSVTHVLAHSWLGLYTRPQRMGELSSNRAGKRTFNPFSEGASTCYGSCLFSLFRLSARQGSLPSPEHRI